MIYLLNDKFNRKDARAVLTEIRGLYADSNIIIRDIRIATNFLEIDMSIPNDFQLETELSLLRRIAPLIESYMIEEKYIGKIASIKYARDLFNSEKYWRTHEVLEGVWKRSENNEKKILNSIILISAALVHYQKNESEICISILRRALDKLDGLDGEYFGIDLNKVKIDITKIIDTRVVEKIAI